EHHRELQAASAAHRAHHARVHDATQALVGQLLEIEHAELQLIRNNAEVETPVAQRIQARLDAQRVKDRR
ncbi:MAG TPA: hypothetical protein VF832_10040, partial [Longimicrobiales bacterium]